MSKLRLTDHSNTKGQPQRDRQGKILIVDDDPIVADSIAEYLNEEGFEVASCYDGHEATAILAREKENPFEIVITDASMPTMDGMALLRAIRNDHPATAVIMVTGYGTIESAVEAVRDGAIDFLAKPIIESELMLSIERARREQMLLKENLTLRAKLDERQGMGEIIEIGRAHV